MCAWDALVGFETRVEVTAVVQSNDLRCAERALKGRAGARAGRHAAGHVSVERLLRRGRVRKRAAQLPARRPRAAGGLWRVQLVRIRGVRVASGGEQPRSARAAQGQRRVLRAAVQVRGLAARALCCIARLQHLIGVVVVYCQVG